MATAEAENKRSYTSTAAGSSCRRVQVGTRTMRPPVWGSVVLAADALTKAASFMKGDSLSFLGRCLFCLNREVETFVVAGLLGASHSSQQLYARYWEGGRILHWEGRAMTGSP
jgi:hypothetical protein